ncbi:MAG: S-layer homology domain-containing protein, partial [bacterium]|nr:S-layer homology domain-containing protein [bacterium]
WQLMDGSTPLAEFQIRGNGENISVSDPTQRDQLPGDIDGDGMLDRWEQTYGAFDPTLDPDQDTLSNLREFQVGTNPNKFDSDGDGASDAAELERGTDPLDALADREAVKSFPDLSEQSPYFEAVMGLTRMGYIQGYGDGTFKPNQAVSRAEALKILMSVIRCENCQSPAEQTRLQFDPADKNLEYFRQFHDGVFQGASDPLKQFAFSQDQVEARDQTIRSYFDIKLEDWFYYCVEVATDLGLVHGYRGVEGGINALGYFLPARQVNIAELMKMVIEAMGEKGAKSEVKYGLPFAWWNDPDNNYLAKAEELKLLLSQHDYLNPQREASRAEVAYAAWQILQKNKDLDLDGDGLTNERDSCPCQAETDVTLGQADGCPEDAEPGRGPVLLPPRDLPTLFSGIEIVQQLDCRCLFVVPADLFNGSTFFGVITGAGEDSDKVYVKSNEVTGPEQE